MVDINAHPVPTAEDEANSAFSHEEGGSSDDDTTHNGPASVAGNKRKRIKCELCKARKVKCDRAEPACSWCARHNRTCVYLERQKPGSRIGFTLELESKVNRVDALLQALWRRVEDHIAHDHHPSGLPPVQSLSPTGSSHVEGLHQLPSAADHAASTGHPLPVAFSASTPVLQGTTPGAYSSPLWRDSADGGRDGLRGGEPRSSLMAGPPSTTATAATLSLAGGDSAPPPPIHPSEHASRVASAPRAGPSSFSSGADLPSDDIVYTLVDLYFKHCNTWCPILDRKSTFGIFFGSTSLSEVDRILLHAIVATTLRFLKGSRLTREMRAHYHAVSKHTVMIFAMEHVSVAALKALVILSLDELGTSNGPRGWNLLSLLAQNVRHLDLCNENSMYLSSAAAEDVPRSGSVRRVAVGRPESWIEDEGRRRLCWMVYLLDRYATVATTTFDFMLDDGKMRRVLPCSYDLFSRNVPVETRSLESGQQQHGAYAVDRSENLGSFSYHCEILRILSRVHEFVRRPIDVSSAADMAGWRDTYRSLDAALDRWLQSLPSEYGRISALCHSDPASRVANWFMLHSAYVTSVVRLHSPAAYPGPAPGPNTGASPPPLLPPSHYAMQRCLAAVQSLRDITRDVDEADGLDLVGPPFAFSLWVAARLLVVHAAAVGGPVDSKIDFFIDILGYVGEYWEVAANYARILARVVQRGRQGDGSFADMRRSAHDLVSLTTSTRRSGLEETSSQPVSLSELDSIDIFDFFNYPKMPEAARGPVITPGGSHPLMQGMAAAAGDGTPRNPDPEADWLGYSSSFR
ncbi:fungal specific transcription factor domain-containing protein [Hirsutella rhossiliensis]|uniref:Fungal specific transcription factor domain-containing protein n=1 Tax=Hirsutella rhossiliensis TaxID=111463 RepID=A0A9P8MQS3_9HYPO|nr:fungal specific transcription factor domain-containing protein [Hirsutella rhossiliensis]KAH0959575.1 fungal specific transcription factor domain-containing protein [Hirsutella rhossiliensis]